MEKAKPMKIQINKINLNKNNRNNSNLILYHLLVIQTSMEEGASTILTSKPIEAYLCVNYGRNGMTM